MKITNIHDQEIQRNRNAVQSVISAAQELGKAVHGLTKAIYLETSIVIQENILRKLIAYLNNMKTTIIFAKQGKLNPNYLNSEQILNGYAKVKEILPEGAHLISEDIATFYSYEVSFKALSTTEFQLDIHTPYHNQHDGQFVAYSLSSLPIELEEDKFAHVQPEKTVLIHNEDESLFVEMTKLDFKIDCRIVYDTYVCPTVHEFFRESKPSCLMALKKSEHQNVINNCPISILPKEELLVELEPNTYRVYYPETPRGLITCPGKKPQFPQLVHKKEITIEKNCKLITKYSQKNAKKGIMTVHANNTQEFVFAKNHYKNFTEKLSLTDKLNQVEDYTGYHIQSLQTQNIVLFVVIFSIGILVLCFCLYQKMCCCQKRPYSDNK